MDGENGNQLKAKVNTDEKYTYSWVMGQRLIKYLRNDAKPVVTTWQFEDTYRSYLLLTIYQDKQESNMSVASIHFP